MKYVEKKIRCCNNSRKETRCYKCSSATEGAGDAAKRVGDEAEEKILHGRYVCESVEENGAVCCAVNGVAGQNYNLFGAKQR